MKNFTNTNNSKKHECYNIFNDLIEYESNIEEKSDDDDDLIKDDDVFSNESNYFYKSIEENIPLDGIIKYPEKDIPEKKVDIIEEFPPLQSKNNYPPGLENFINTPTTTFKFLQKNNSPIIFNSNSPFLKEKEDFFKKKSTFLNTPYKKTFSYYPNFSYKQNYYSHNFNRSQSDFNRSQSDSEKDDSDGIKNSTKSGAVFDKTKNIFNSNKIIPIRKFIFGNVRYDTKQLKCIKSFGIILFSLSNILEVPKQNKNWRKYEDFSIKKTSGGQSSCISYLIYQRRDTYGFMDFMRGLWNDDKKMFFLLSMISKDERKRLLNYNFDELWEDLWMSHSPDPTGIYIAGRERARKKFNMVREKVMLYLNDPTTQVVCDSPWGFPKGKKNSKEGDIECAKREFFEETKIDPVNINILQELGTIIEQYIADNDKYYTTFYYIAETPNILPIKHIPTPGCIRTSAVSDEVANLIWATYEDSSLLLDDQKRCILEEAHLRIMNYING